MEFFNDINVGIDRYLGKSGNYMISQSLVGDNIPQSEVLVYDSIKQLYYNNYLFGENGEISLANTASFNTDGTIEGNNYQTNFDNFEVTTLNPQKYFPLPTEGNPARIGVISIPSKLFGDRIQPNSINIYSPQSGSIYDDGEGRLFVYNSLDEKRYVGNVIYSHGLIIITRETYEGDNDFINTRFIDTYINSPHIVLNFNSSHTIFETQYKITISPDEFNYSLNPTLLVKPIIPPSPSPSATPSVSISPSVSPSNIPVVSLSPTPSISISPTTTPSRTPSVTPSLTLGASLTPTPSISISPSKTPSITPSKTPSITPSITPSRTPSVSMSAPAPSPSNTPFNGYIWTIELEDYSSTPIENYYIWYNTTDDLNTRYIPFAGLESEYTGHSTIYSICSYYEPIFQEVYTYYYVIIPDGAFINTAVFCYNPL